MKILFSFLLSVFLYQTKAQQIQSAPNIFIITTDGFRWQEVFTGADAHAIAFYGGYGYITNQGANTVSILNAVTHAKIKDIVVGKKPNGITFK